MQNPPPHILVFRLSAMGDVAMIVPVLRTFSMQNPQAKITLVSRPFFKPFFNDISNLSFFSIDVNQKHKGFLGLIRLFLELKKQNITHVADLHNVLRSKVIRGLFFVFGIKTAATDKGRKEKKALTRLKNKVFKPLKPMIERHAEVFKQLGFSIEMQNPVFPKKAILTKKILKISGIKTQKWIGIAPFAQYESKVYPLDLMQQVIDELDKNQKILLFGGGNEEIQKLNQLQNKRENIIVIAGKLTFQEELQLISNLDLMVSMDSANGHIAAMLGIKVLTIWGATHPFAGFTPFNQLLENSLTPDRNQFPRLPTSVYGNKKIAGYENAMNTISPSTIIQRINELLH